MTSINIGDVLIEDIAWSNSQAQGLDFVLKPLRSFVQDNKRDMGVAYTLGWRLL